jgi:hypothetical protein
MRLNMIYQDRKKLLVWNFGKIRRDKQMRINDLINNNQFNMQVQLYKQFHSQINDQDYIQVMSQISNVLANQVNIGILNETK